MKGRQHRIHKFVLERNTILCKERGWKCSDENWDNVECKICLRKREIYELVKNKLGEKKNDKI